MSILLPLSQRLRLLQVQVVAFSRDRLRLRQRGQAQTVTDRLLILVSIALARRHHPIRNRLVVALEQFRESLRQSSQGRREMCLTAHRVSVTRVVMGTSHRHRRPAPVERGKDHALLIQ